MAGELKHPSVGPQLTQAEWEDINSHTIANGVAGDMLYYDGANIKRIPAGANGTVMTMVAGLPAWAAAGTGITGPIRLSDGTVGAPAYSWTDDTDSGIYKRTAGNSGTTSVAAAGQIIAEFGTSGFALASTSRLGWYKAVLDTGYDIVLNRDGVGILGMRNGTNTQTINIYQSDQGSGLTDYERMSITGVTGTGGNITMQTDGVGANNLGLTFTTAGVGTLTLTGPTATATGLELVTQLTGSGLTMRVISAGANENVSLYSKGTGAVLIGVNLDGGTWHRSAVHVSDSTPTNIPDELLKVNLPHYGTGTTKNTGYFEASFNSSTTVWGRAIYARVFTAAAAFTLTDAAAMFIRTPFIDAPSVITRAYGLYIETQSGAGTNYAIYTNTGAVRFGDSVTSTGQFLAADGTVGAPSIGWTSDNDATGTGFYRFAANAIGVALNGVSKFMLNGTVIGMTSDMLLAWGSSTTNPNTSDTILARDLANTIAQRNGVTAQNFRLYNTFTTVTTVGEWVSLNFTDTLNTLTFGTKAGSTTGVVRPMIIGPATATQTNIAGAGLTLVGGSALSGVAIGGIITLTPGLGSGAANGNVVISRGGLVISAAIAGALEVGANGATNPVLRVNTATGSVATGLQITGAAAAGGVTLAPISSGANEDLILSGIGTGKVRANASYGAITTDTDGATVTFDMAVTNLHTVVLGGNRTLAVSNVSVGQTFYLYLVQDGTGTRVPTWFTTIKWAGGVAPTLTTTLNKGDLFTFLCTSAGNYVGLVVGQNI